MNTNTEPRDLVSRVVAASFARPLLVAVGVILGVIAGNVAALFFKIPAVIPWDWVAIGMGVCSLVGLIFGVYPAARVSRLDPITALRSE